MPKLTTPLGEVIAARFSCRHYAPERTVPRELIQQCLEAGRLAPSACNRQPWRFVVVDAPDKRADLCTRGRLPGIAHKWWDDVPVFLVLCVDLDLLAHRAAPLVSGIPYYLIDLGIAGEHVVLAATALGLGTCWIGWFSEKGVKRVLEIPRAVRVGGIITLGYPAATPPGRASRKCLGDIVRWNTWHSAAAVQL